MFDRGAELREIVIALQIVPDEVRRLYRQWSSSLDDPPPGPEPLHSGLLDEDPAADDKFARAIARAAGATPSAGRKPPRTP
jgi:hypothetical protein